MPASTLLFDESTGRCRAIVNAGDLTGLRTASVDPLRALKPRRLIFEDDFQNCFCAGDQSTRNSERTAYRHLRQWSSGVLPCQSVCFRRSSTQESISDATDSPALIPPLFQNSLGVTLIVRSDTERSRALLDRLTKENPKLKIECLIAGSPEAIAAVGAADVICWRVEAQDMVERSLISSFKVVRPRRNRYSRLLSSNLVFTSTPVRLLLLSHLFHQNTATKLIALSSQSDPTLQK